MSRQVADQIKRVAEADSSFDWRLAALLSQIAHHDVGCTQDCVINPEQPPEKSLDMAMRYRLLDMVIKSFKSKNSFV